MSLLAQIEGLTAFGRGYYASALRAFPSRGLDLMVYHTLRETLVSRGLSLSITVLGGAVWMGYGFTHFIKLDSRQWAVYSYLLTSDPLPSLLPLPLSSTSQLPPGEQPTIFQSLLFGAAAGVTSQSVTMPLLTLRTRMMAQVRSEG